MSSMGFYQLMYGSRAATVSSIYQSAIDPPASISALASSRAPSPTGGASSAQHSPPPREPLSSPPQLTAGQQARQPSQGEPLVKPALTQAAGQGSASLEGSGTLPHTGTTTGEHSDLEKHSPLPPQLPAGVQGPSLPPQNKDKSACMKPVKLDVAG